MEHDMCGPCDPKRACLKDLSSLARHERQQLYAEILRDSQRVLTPSQVKEELEWRGATFAFVGQDMAAMRQMPFVQFEGRGMYRWNSLFKGDLSEVFNKKTGELDYDGYHKRARNTSEEDDADDDEHACIAEVSGNSDCDPYLTNWENLGGDKLKGGFHVKVLNETSRPQAVKNERLF